LLAALGLIGALSHYRHAYHAEQALRAADKAAYVNAQAQAQTKALAALQATEAAYRSKADASEQTYRSKLADARGLADHYIAVHRVRVETPSRVASGTIASAQGGSASSADRPSAAPDLVEVTAADIQICTVNTTRLEAAHDWALGL
jgi:hypothetical protein